VLQRARGRFRHHVGQTRGTPLRDTDRVRTGGMRRTDNRAEVMWIFDSIENHKQST